VVGGSNPLAPTITTGMRRADWAVQTLYSVLSTLLTFGA
jgi:hypothetical protein